MIVEGIKNNSKSEKSSISLKDELEYTFKWAKFLQISLGSLPNKNGKYTKRNLYLVLFYLVYCWQITFYAFLVEWPDLQKVVDKLGPWICISGAWLKYYIFFVYKDLFFKLQQKIRNEFWDERKLVEAEIKILITYAKKALNYNVRLNSIVIIAGILTWIRPIIIMSFFQSGHQEYNGRILPYKLWLPNFINPYDDPNYEIIFVIETVGTYFTVAILIMYDCLFLLIVINVTGQFIILQNRMRNFNKFYEYKTAAKTPEQFLKECIAEHQRLYDYCVDIETVSTYGIFTEYVAVCIFICISAFLVLNGSQNFYILFENFACLLAAILQLFIYCFAAGKLTEEAEELANSLYFSNWENASKESNKLIFLGIQRSQKPIYLTVAKFTPLTLATFGQVMQTAASYLTVLRSCYEE